MSVMTSGAGFTGARKRDQVAALIRDRIADGSLQPGALVPTATELARETGFAARTCQSGVLDLLDDGTLIRVSPTARSRVAAGPAGDGQKLMLDLARSLALHRHTAGLTQKQLAAVTGASVTAICHAETGRLWQARQFWEKADSALQAGGRMVSRYDAWQASLALETGDALLARYEAWRAEAAPVEGEPGLPAAAGPAGPDAPGGIVITLPCDPMRVTVKWGDGSVTTVQPGPA